MSIIIYRIRTGCSALNNDLFLKNIIESPLCACRSGDTENADHFFLKCMLYNEHRLELFRKVSQFCNISLDVLLKGNLTLSFETNMEIFKSVQRYIQSTKRFWSYLHSLYPSISRAIILLFCFSFFSFFLLSLLSPTYFYPLSIILTFLYLVLYQHNNND